MKKFILTIMLLIYLVTNVCFAYIEDKVFCTLWKNSITVTMEKENNYKCTEYLTLLSQVINTEYIDILSIQKLIKQWYDVEYRKEVMEMKKEKLRKVIALKWQIETAISEFDSNLFIKLKDYIIYIVSLKQNKYEKVLKHLNNLEKQGSMVSKSIKKKMEYLQEDITIIDNIIEATGYDTLMNNFNRHLYLQNQIEWK